MRDGVIRVAAAGARVEVDEWTFVEAPVATDRCVVSLATWKQRRASLRAAGSAVGVWLAPGDDPGDLAADLDFLRLVAVHFPKFTDGRGYSTAWLLRTRLGFRGELRAFGDVGRDQLFHLRRCGFDSFRLAPHRDPHAALAGLGDFSLRYQGSVDDPLPLFRKRLATAVFATGHTSRFGGVDPYLPEATPGRRPPAPRRAFAAAGGNDSFLQTGRK